MTANRTTSAELRAALVRQLVSEGSLPDPEWRRIFGSVSRESFIPYFFTPCRDRPGWRLAEGSDEWREGIYLDDALVTQLNNDDSAIGAIRHGETVEGPPTSSSSAPTLMAAMLHALQVSDDSNVLEIGTGTGYNAALLTERLGPARVTSIEFDPGLADRARAALAQLGYRPTVITGDGAAGHPPRAPYDRIIATVAFPQVPAVWLEQTGEGALIVVPLGFAGHGGLMALLRRDDSGQASGRFLGQYGGFMHVRNQARPGSPVIRRDLLADAVPTEIPAAVFRGDHPAAFYLSMTSPVRYSTMGFTPEGGTEQTWVQGTDGSTFVLTSENTVAADGPLWSSLAAAYTRWHELGCPARERFGLTVTATTQTAWLDEPDNPIRTW